MRWPRCPGASRRLARSTARWSWFATVALTSVRSAGSLVGLTQTSTRRASVRYGGGTLHAPAPLACALGTAHDASDRLLQVYEAGRAIRESGYKFDVVYTSLLKRTVHTGWLLLKQLDQIYLPVRKTWRLNERSYGALTGRTPEEAILDHGAPCSAPSSENSAMQRPE